MSRNFIILSAGRTGSTLLASALDAHPDVTCLDEVLKPTRLAISGMTYDQQHRALFADDPRPARGCKLFYHHLPRRDRRWGWFFDNCRIIHLTRRDLLAWHVSMETARRTGRWQGAGLPLAGRRIAIDPGRMQEQIDKYVDNVARTRSRMCPERSLELTYEGLMDWERAICEVERFLGVAEHELPMNYSRMNPEPIAQRVVNWDEVGDEAKRIAHKGEELCRL